VTDDPVGRFTRSLGIAAQRAAAMMAALLLDGGKSPGPNWTHTAASFGLGPDLKPLSAAPPPVPGCGTTSGNHADICRGR
jgi:hypothetical protein